MNLLFTDEAWEEYVYWQETNKTMKLYYTIIKALIDELAKAKV